MLRINPQPLESDDDLRTALSDPARARDHPALSDGDSHPEGQFRLGEVRPEGNHRHRRQ
jgi:hypothetical protein